MTFVFRRFAVYKFSSLSHFYTRTHVAGHKLYPLVSTCCCRHVSYIGDKIVATYQWHKWIVIMSPRYSQHVSRTSNLNPVTCIRIQVTRPGDMCPIVNAALLAYLSNASVLSLVWRRMAWRLCTLPPSQATLSWWGTWSCQERTLTSTLRSVLLHQFLLTSCIVRLLTVTVTNSNGLIYLFNLFTNKHCEFMTYHPMLEYACPAWHSSLTVAQTKALESLQQRAMKIMFPYKEYWFSLIGASADTLESRREQLTERFFKRSVLRESSCLHYLLPDKRDLNITDFVMRKHLRFSPLELKDTASHFYRTIWIFMISTCPE